MSYRVFSPQEYPLPYVIENIQDWPIYRISQQKDPLKELIVSKVLEKFQAKFPTEKEQKEELAKIIFQEKIRLTQTPWKADPKDERQFWNNVKSKFIQLDAINKETDTKPIEIVTLIIERYINEIVGNFDPKAYSLARTLLPQFFGRIFKAAPGKWFKTISSNAKTIHEKIPITGNIEKIRNLAKKGTVIVLPTHFSNMDSIMVGWVLSEVGLPAFIYGAGLNLFSIKLLSYFMSNLGAYKVDRRKKNSLYLETLKSYSRESISAGAHSIFFPGGTRSRSGTLEKRLKLGLLGTAVEAQKNHYKNFNKEVAPKIFVVPLVINYHFVLEAESLINDYLKETGKEKFLKENDEYSTSYKMIKFIFKFLSASSSLAISFGEPMDVIGNLVDENGDSHNHLGHKIDVRNYFVTNGELTDDQQREDEYTRILGERTVKQYFKFNVVLSSHLVCFAAFEYLRNLYREVDIYTLLRTPPEELKIPADDLNRIIETLKDRLKEMNKNNMVLLSPEIRFTTEKLIDHGMSNINLFHANSPLLRSNDSSHYYSEDIKLLYYYHNRIEGYGLEKYVK
jgi:glycerol-3-phosphate O-acyltransferase